MSIDARGCAVALCLLLTGCESCVSQGGVLVQHGYYYVWQWIDMQRGIGYMQPHPNMICEKGKE